MSIDPRHVRLICFDVDGTLSDTDNQYVQRIELWLAPVAYLSGVNAHQLARSLIYRMETPGNLILEILDILHMDRPVGQLIEFIEHLQPSRSTPSFMLIEGVRELLNQLQARYHLAIVSSRSQRKTMAFLEHFDLLPFFGPIATSQTCPRTKPHRDPILWVADQVGVNPAECLMVGDTTHDIRAGKAAGAQTIGVLCGFGREDELRRAGADLILSSTTDLAFLMSN